MLPRLIRTTVFGFAFSLFICRLLLAATPASGELSQPGTSVTWTSPAFTSVNASSGSCQEGVTCDTFRLKLTVPSGKVGILTFRIEWTSSSNDFDLFIYDSEGNEIDHSADGPTESEQVSIAYLPSGDYRVVSNAFIAVNTSLTGTVTLDAIADPPGPPPAPTWSSDIRFSSNTMADYSAISGEPYIDVDRQDNIFVSVPFGFSTTVSLLWKSSDGGRSFVPLGTPILRDAVTAPGGGDTHLDFDANNWLYYIDLSAACITTAVSLDQGETFPRDRTNSVACVSEENPEAIQDDRQWVAAFGNGIAYATWRNLAVAAANDSEVDEDDASDNFWLFKTVNGGLTWDKGTTLGTVGQSGPLQIDKKMRRVSFKDGSQKDAIVVYQIYYRGTNLRVMRIMDPNDGSAIQVDHLSIADPKVSISNVFPVLAVDSAGNLYAAWSQRAAEIYMATSTDRGNTWSAPVRISHLTGTNIMPWIVAGDPGRVDIVWYRTALEGNPIDDNSLWEIFMAQSLNALSSYPTITHSRVSQNIIHRGQICLAGLNCDLDGRDRSFLEFPSIAVDSKGSAVITYNDNFNQAEASYVMVAKQTRGPSLYQSVGFLKPQPGSVSIAAPTSGTAVVTPAFTARGNHTLPPKNFDQDESGDARFPDHGAVIGANISAFDIQSVTMENAGQNLQVTMHIADLRTTALATAAAEGGGEGLLYLTQWHTEEKIVWVAAEIRGTIPVFYTGTISTINSATSKKFITYNPDPANSLRVTGSIEPSAPGRIVLQIPSDLVGGVNLVSVTGYAFSERGPLLPVGAGVPDATSLPLKIDASGAFSYTIGDARKSDGIVEVSVDDAKFKKPKIATLNQNQWEISFPTSELRAGSHTLYVRQRIDGTSASQAASVNFTIPKALP